MKFPFAFAILFTCFTFADALAGEPLDDWRARMNPAGTVSLRSVCFGNGVFVSVGDSGTILTSEDGGSWVAGNSGVSSNLFAVAFANNIFLAVGDAGVILTSGDGTVWTNKIYGDGLLRGISYGNQAYVLVDSRFGGRGFYRSVDADNWASITFSGVLPGGIAFTGDRFVVLGGRRNGCVCEPPCDCQPPPPTPAVFTSSSGVTWSFNGFISGANLPRDLVFTSDRFVAVGNKGMALTMASNLTGRTLQVTGITNDLVSLTIGNGVFVAVGDKGSILTSTNGTNWIGRSSGTTASLLDVAFGNGSFVAVGDSGTLLHAGAAPAIGLQPTDTVTNAGADVTMEVSVSGSLPLSYQWLRNGKVVENLASANAKSAVQESTSPLFQIPAVTVADSDRYSVRVWNTFGSVESKPASLAVLGDGANGNEPVQITPTLPVPPSGENSLVFVTHGWQWTFLNPLGPPSQPWMVEMTNAIRQNLIANGTSSQWRVEPYYWLQEAWTALPTTARNRAADLGTLIGKNMASQGWQRVHLIAHSAGAALIDAIAEQLNRSANPPVVHETFLDPFTGRFLEGRLYYGASAHWADNYFAISSDSDLYSLALGIVPNSTGGKLMYAHNVDVGAALDAAVSTPFIVGAGTANSTPRVHLASHGSPITFYSSTINGLAAPCASGYGFPLSLEAGGAAQWASFARNNSPNPVCGNASFSQNQQPLRVDAKFNLTTVPSGSSGTELLGLGALLTSTPPAQQIANDNPSWAVKSAMNTPAWLAMAVTMTAAVNVVQFDATFVETNSSEGLLTVYWNTNEIGTVDERVVGTELQTYRFVLPNTISNGLYTLSFRLDSFGGISSSMTVTNVSTGFIGITEPIKLGLTVDNGVPSLQLTLEPNFTYLIQRSTNLADWTPAALILSTNGTAHFIDTTATNAATMFYRARLQ